VLHTSCPGKSMKKPQKNENKKQMKWPQSFIFVSAAIKNSSTHFLRV